VRSAYPQVWDLSLKMLGKPHKPTFAAKAAETHGMLLFCVQILQKHLYKFRGVSADAFNRTELLITAGLAALAFDDALNTCDATPSVTQRQSMLDSILRHVFFAEAAGIHIIPKHHLLLHLAQKAGYLGSPKKHSTYHDEHLNGIVGTMARHSSVLTFSTSLLRRYELLSSMRSQHAAL